MNTALKIEEVGNELRVELTKPNEDKPIVFHLGHGKAYFDETLRLIREIADLDSRDKIVKQIVGEYRSNLYGF